MHDAATPLLKLIEIAELELTRRRIDGRTEIEALRATLEATVSLCPDPQGGLLIDDEAILLAQVLCLIRKQRSHGDERRAALLQQLAGVLLPAVRQSASRAIEVRRDTRPTP